MRKFSDYDYMIPYLTLDQYLRDVLLVRYQAIPTIRDIECRNYNYVRPNVKLHFT